jgi:adenylosuccinate synthase
MTKSDVMSGFETVRICTSYLSGGKESAEIPFGNADLEPVYTNLPGWKEDISGIREFAKLPENLKHYIKFIEDQTGIRVTMVSVGPDREETIFREK